MTITITISTENAAFENNGEGEETARILHELADRIEAQGLRDLFLNDDYGNRVGQVTLGD